MRVYITLLLFVLYVVVSHFLTIKSEPHEDPITFSLFMAFLPVLVFNCGRFVSAVLTPVLYFFLIINLYLALKFGEISENMRLAISGTNAHEAYSMLIATNKIYLVAFVVSIIAVTIFAYKNSKVNYVNIVVALLMLSIPVVRVTYEVVVGTKNHNLPEEKYIFIERYLPGYIGNTIYVLAMHFSGDEKTKPVKHMKSDQYVLKKSDEKEKNVIIIVGESDNSDRHNYYGYSKQNTTPNLNKLNDSGRLCVVANSHSSANMTRYAVPMILSFYSPDEKEKLYSEKNIIELASDNGYHTYWIASQDGRGPYARPFGYLSEFSDYTTRQDYNNLENHVDWHDESLIPVIEDKFSEPYKNKFFVIHIMGSHLNYSDKVGKEDIQALPAADTYDRSIHRTDRIIQKIVDLADKELIDYDILYTSDHGEIINEGHGLKFGGYDQYKTPTLIVSAKKKYCDMAEYLRNDDGYFTELMDKFIILDMIGYNVSNAAINSVKKYDHVLHSDGIVYDYKKLPTKKS